jgi:hypothetical protein
VKASLYLGARPERGLSQTAAGEWQRRLGNFYGAMAGDALRVGTTRGPIEKQKTPLANQRGL